MSKRTEREKKVSGNSRLRNVWSEWKGTLVLLLMMCAFRSAIADWNQVPTGSMKPTIMEGDRILVNKLAYDLRVPFTNTRLAEWGDPARGDIVVFWSPVDGKRFIKRVIGIPGDHITINDNKISVNGVAQPLSGKRFIDSFSSLPTVIAEEELDGKVHNIRLSPRNVMNETSFNCDVPAGKYFVMGDNRNNSFDSRYFGCVDRSSIIGKGVAVVFSFNRALTKLR